MENRVDYLFQEWAQLGGEVLLAEKKEVVVRDAHLVLAESTANCRDSGRLTWVVLNWLLRHIDEINVDTLIEQTKTYGDLSVLGALCDAALMKIAHVKFQKIIEECQPALQVEPFFKRVAKSPLALRLTQENALDVFRRWNFLCNELQYI